MIALAALLLACVSFIVLMACLKPLADRDDDFRSVDEFERAVTALRRDRG